MLTILRLVRVLQVLFCLLQVLLNLILKSLNLYFCHLNRDMEILSVIYDENIIQNAHFLTTS